MIWLQLWWSKLKDWWPRSGRVGYCSCREPESLSAPSLQSIKQKANVAAWTEICRALRCAVMESSAMHIDQCCIVRSERALYRCLQCAAWAIYCPACFDTAHSKVNLFHTSEVWKVGHIHIIKFWLLYSYYCWFNNANRMVPVTIQNRMIDVWTPHCIQEQNSTLHLCVVNVNHWLWPWYKIEFGLHLIDIPNWHLFSSFWTGQNHFSWSVK